jgi:hypothetical protein
MYTQAKRALVLGGIVVGTPAALSAAGGSSSLGSPLSYRTQNEIRGIPYEVSITVLPSLSAPSKLPVFSETRRVEEGPIGPLSPLSWRTCSAEARFPNYAIIRGEITNLATHQRVATAETAVTLRLYKVSAQWSDPANQADRNAKNREDDDTSSLICSNEGLPITRSEATQILDSMLRFEIGPEEFVGVDVFPQQMLTALAGDIESGFRPALSPAEVLAERAQGSEVTWSYKIAQVSDRGPLRSIYSPLISVPATRLRAVSTFLGLRLDRVRSFLPL